MEETLPEPTLVGPAGMAWLLDLDGMRARAPETKDATLALWMVEARWAHPLWHSYLITLVHLRPMEGVNTLHYLDDGTHEIAVGALNPDKPRSLTSFHLLTPGNFAAQFIEPSDEAAMARIAGTAGEICEGSLNPDTDAMGHWVARFGGNMVRW